ncbi:hypothetical protein SDRG_03167 [Saprolegnia diclina VS20]|uniref:Kelch repeat protein n=1 Tax=Saprolegnia diclina (strain VS20) TaxID=1156394 RepID=T0R089_SAPDV|nr:hypothetical protein SDRG_03167 [Saprolegnia diclina VS20]EQC39740.1 hypothetical protein SDRG_03167 [Saprolegnia diclina VS20]|eukprot:XP_008607012.1 hypothetical protein SDRG_03167 [Saprolegnia diclina VS20]
MKRPRLTTGVLCLVVTALPIDASNWAEISGTKQTNAAIESGTPWTRRWGHAAISQLFSAAETAAGKLSRIYILGGDDRMQLATMGKDFRAYPGGGSFRNDVWATTGIVWNTSINILTFNQWGEPAPQIVAELTWSQTNAGKLPPPGILYSDWIACLSAPWNPYPPSGCDDPTKAPGEYIADAMFSPRRNFAALAFNNHLYVFGGRARELLPVPIADTIGMAPRPARWMEYAILKNDVWKSQDAGVSWSLATIGCAMPTALETYKAGGQPYQCTTQKDCFGDSKCNFDPITLTGTCVCNMWSPREYHTVVSYFGTLYLAGGYTSVQRNLCGPEIAKRPLGNEYACGGNYRKFMNDVWMSPDGQRWVQLTPSAAWTGRGEHAMVGWEGHLWIFGGRDRDVRSSTHQGLRNDVWRSVDGIEWVLDALHAEWSPRAKMSVVPVTQPNESYLIAMFGENDDVFLGDVWTRASNASRWSLDFGPSTTQRVYVTPQSSVALLQGMAPTDVSTLEAANIRVIADLTGLAPDTVIDLRTMHNVPICDYIAVAKLVVQQCNIAPVGYDGAEWTNVSVLQGANAVANAAATAAAAAAAANSVWDGCAHQGTPVFDWITGLYKWPDVGSVPQVDTKDPFPNVQASVCRWTPTPRSSHASTVHNGTVYVFGGKVDNQLFENDAWYRDPTLPTSYFTLTPESSTSQTIFQFTSAKPGTIFQYHVIDLVEMLVVRNWTDCLGEINFVSWLDGGYHRIRLRAIDAAGNVESTFDAGRNLYDWTYVPALPWNLIIGMIALCVVLLAGLFLEWRRRRKQAAMERYAMKRMRRKMRGNKKGGNKDVNWRATYDESKDGQNKKKKKKPKKSDKKGAKPDEKKASAKKSKKSDTGKKKTKADVGKENPTTASSSPKSPPKPKKKDKKDKTDKVAPVAKKKPKADSQKKKAEKAAKKKEKTT